MHILIADKLSDQGAAALVAAGHTVTERPKVTGEELLQLLRDERPHVLIVRSTRVTAEMMDADGRLELVVRAGAGYDTIDVDGASERGIFVANCPGKNAAAVAELTMGLILSLDRRIPDNVVEARSGRWNKGAFSKARGVKGLTLGIVGLGHIGREVARRARAFEMEIVAWSRSLTEAEAFRVGARRMASPVDVAREADVVTLHVAATAETRHLAGPDFFEAMKPGAFFINTTRGSVVDEEALRRALDEKPIRAALDVIEKEPAQKEGALHHPLAAHPRVYLTHHIGASTEQAQEAIAEEAVRIVRTYGETGDVPNCVNLERHSPATYLLTVRHLDRVGVLAGVLDEMRRAGWNVQEMENLVFEGAKAACARITFDGDRNDEVTERIERLEHVLAVSLIER